MASTRASAAPELSVEGPTRRPGPCVRTSAALWSVVVKEACVRHHVTVVFDDYVPATTSPTQFYTSNEWNSLLGRFDQFAIFCLVDNNSAGAFDLWVDHSGDGRNWLQRNDKTQNQPSLYTVGTGDITWATLSATSPNYRAFSDSIFGLTFAGSSGVYNGQAAIGPILPYVRLNMRFAASVGGHVRVTFTGRGVGV
jgi:hypothetical protein